MASVHGYFIGEVSGTPVNQAIDLDGADAEKVIQLAHLGQPTDAESLAGSHNGYPDPDGSTGAERTADSAA